MAWILAAREEPDSIRDHVLERFGNQLTAEMIDGAADSYDPSWLLAGVIESDGTGSAHFTGRYTDAPGMVRAAVARDSADAFDADTGEPLRELWLDVVGFGGDLSAAIKRGRSARSINITLDQRYPDNSTGPYIGHLALLTPGEQPRIPGMAPLDPSVFEDGVADLGARDQIAASGEGAINRLSISRSLSTEAPTMPDDKLKAADDEDEKVDAALEDVVEDDDEDEDDDKEESSASASIEAAVNAAVEAAMSKRRPARRAPKRQELNAADIGAAVAASITPLFSKFENALADAKKESARQAAIAHATELAASLPPGLRDGAVEQLAAIDDKKQRTAMGEILASAAGVLAPVNLEDLKVEAGAKIDSIYIEAAAADLGIGIDDIRGPIRDSVMKLAASKASSAKATEVH